MKIENTKKVNFYFTSKNKTPLNPVFNADEYEDIVTAIEEKVSETFDAEPEHLAGFVKFNERDNDAENNLFSLWNWATCGRYKVPNMGFIRLEGFEYASCIWVKFKNNKGNMAEAMEAVEVVYSEDNGYHVEIISVDNEPYQSFEFTKQILDKTGFTPAMLSDNKLPTHYIDAGFLEGRGSSLYRDAIILEIGFIPYKAGEIEKLVKPHWWETRTQYMFRVVSECFNGSLKEFFKENKELWKKLLMVVGKDREFLKLHTTDAGVEQPKHIRTDLTSSSELIYQIMDEIKERDHSLFHSILIHACSYKGVEVEKEYSMEKLRNELLENIFS